MDVRRPRALLLNGPPGIGKSTLAARLIDDTPLALNIDIDSIRRQLGGWDVQPSSKRLARELGKEMARVHLLAGHDVSSPSSWRRMTSSSSSGTLRSMPAPPSSRSCYSLRRRTH
jgi:predicted kinase